MTRRRIFILFLTFLAVFSGAVYFVLHGTGAARSLVRQKIGETIRDELFRLDDAEISLTAGTITVTKFEIEHPNPEVRQSPLVSIEKIEVNVGTNPLGGVGVPRHVVLDGLALHLTKGEIPELSQILREAGVSSPGGDTPLPSISVTNASVRLHIAKDRPDITFSALQLKSLPTESDPDEFELVGTMVSPLGHVITISGGWNAKTGKLKTLLTMGDIPIRPEQAAAYQKEAAEYLDAAGVSGSVKKAILWLDVKGNGEADPTKGEQRIELGLNADFVDLAAAPVDFPYQITGATGRVHGTLGKGGVVKFRLEDESEDGNIVATGKITKLLPEGGDDAFAPLIDIHLDVDDLRVGERLERAFEGSRIEAVKGFHAALEPSAGKLSGKVQVFNDAPGAPLQVHADVTLEDIAARFHGLAAPSGPRTGFPYPLHGVTGAVSIRPDRITIENVKAKDADGAPVSINGQINVVGRDVRPNVDIRGDDIRFSQSIRDSLAALSKEGAEAYDEYSPRGRSNVLVRLRDVGRGTRYTVDLTPTKASAAYVEFPYRVHELDGLVKIANEGVWIDLKGRNEGAPVSVRGRFLFESEQASGGVQSELWVKGTGLPLDKELHAACRAFSTEITARWDELQPTGLANCEFTMWKEVDDKDYSYDVHVHVSEGTAKLRDFPMPLAGLEGDLFVYGTGNEFRCDVSPIRGEIASDPDARIFVQGSARHGAEGLTTDITTIVRHLRLTSEVGAAIEKAGIAADDLWREFKLDGVVDVTARHHQQPGEAELRHDVGIQLRGVSSKVSILPGVARDLHGEIEVKDKTATFKEIEGVIGESTVTLRSGKLVSQGDVTVVEFLIDAESIPVDQRLANLLNGPARATYLASDISGRLGLNGMKLEFRVPGEGPLKIGFTGEVNAHDLFIDVGLPGEHSLEHLNGIATLTGTIDERGTQLKGNLKNVAFELTNQRISGITTKFVIDSERLLLHELQFNVAGGVVQGVGPNNLSLEYRYGGTEGQLRAFLSFSQISLNNLLKDRGLAHSKVRGLLSGTINIRDLRGANFLDMIADGEVGVNNGRLGRVPIFSALYSHIAEDKRPQFTQGYAKFAVENQKIKLTKITARSTEIKIEGEGVLEMDGYMDVNLRIPGLFGRAADILILPPLIDWGVSKVVSFQLYGYIREPKLSWSYNMAKGRTSLSPIGPPPSRPPSTGR